MSVSVGPGKPPPVLAAGARRHEHQPSPDGRFVVYLDPVGHPFCLCEE